MSTSYRGRFAPSPTGPLHAGSLAAAFGSWLDARAHGGRWLLRIEDIDPPREVVGASSGIVADLAACGLAPDEPPLYQSGSSAAYEAALQRLAAAGLLFGCRCSRRDIDEAARHAGRAPGVYPGTCRGHPIEPGRAIRIRVPPLPVRIEDRRLGAFTQSLEHAVGDFTLRRADGLWSYQLAVVVDDAQSGITDVVRGADLLDNTPRQVFLQRALGLATPRYLHLPLVLGADGAKLSKQNGARAIDAAQPAAELARAWIALGFDPLPPAADRSALMQHAVEAWRRRWTA